MTRPASSELRSGPPPLTPAPPVVPSALVLDYSHRPRPRPRAERSGTGVVLAAAIACSFLSVGLLAGLIDMLIVTWPSFGATLLAAPVLLGVLAFGTISVASFRALAGDGNPPPTTPRPSMPAAPAPSART